MADENVKAQLAAAKARAKEAEQKADKRRPDKSRPTRAGRQQKVGGSRGVA
jgi:hypothetical protein